MRSWALILENLTITSLYFAAVAASAVIPPTVDHMCTMLLKAKSGKKRFKVAEINPLY